ncbi:MAG: hypothetical protein IPK07_26305 [Deltaproteobacteria bacterium]|nr:hypothetical protein [Deltaproteobacteria bacterium]
MIRLSLASRTLLSPILLVTACGGSSGGSSTTDLAPSAAYAARTSAYLEHCLDRTDATQGSIYAQACTAYAGQRDYHVEEIREILAELDSRHGSVDFHIQPLLRVVYFDRRTPSLPDDLRADIEKTLLGFKYWLDEPGSDDLVWWSENHQILFHTAELLAGQLLPDDTFGNSGMTGRDHVAHATELLDRWLDTRGRFGFSEWHSNVYWVEDLGGLVNLAELAEDDGIRVRAAMLVDSMAFTLATNSYRGLFATTHGRTYDSKLLGGLNDSTREATYLLLGLAAPGSIDELDAGDFAATELATSERYAPPAILEAIAAEAEPSFEHRQRDNITLEEGPGYGIGYEDLRDVMYWWGLTGYVAPPVVEGSFDLIDTYDLWNGGPPWDGLGFLKPFVGSPLLEEVASALAPMSRGLVLENANTYTYRTPHYQLSGAQDWKPGSWTGQIHIWQATLDAQAYVFTTYPGGSEGGYAAGAWTGGFVPRATLHRNVGVIQYRRPKIPILDQVLFSDFSHAYFRRASFDEVAERDGWVIGRKGSSYVALYSQHPTRWAEDNDFELIADAKENVWLIELGDAESSGSFADFVAAITAARVTIGESVVYDSPSAGRVEVGWTGPMTVDGTAVDIGPYPRWENRYATTPFGEPRAEIERGGEKLILDFAKPERRVVGSAPG